MVKLYRAENDSLRPVANTRLPDEDRLQKWIAADPKIIGLDLLVLGREVPSDYGGRIDILALDAEGGLVVIECKRDRTPRDVVAQVLDYASWIAKLTTRDVFDIAASKLGTPLDTAFKNRFGLELPETLNGNHSLVIVAAEFDASSRRIVEYLAEEHGMAINTAFFSVFEHAGETLLATDWLLDQEEVVQRAESRARAPWSGLWYCNVGQSEQRSWEDMCRYGFIAAGGGPAWSGPLGRLSPGDRVCAYLKQHGYVGFGVVTAQAVPLRDFLVDGTPVLKLPLTASNFGHDVADDESCEHVVAVEWRRTYPAAEAKTFSGAFANQNIVCKLRDAATVDFLKTQFPIDEETT